MRPLSHTTTHAVTACALAVCIASQGLRSQNEKLVQRVQELHEKTQFQNKAISDLTSLSRGSLKDGELDAISELRANIKVRRKAGWLVECPRPRKLTWGL